MFINRKWEPALIVDDYFLSLPEIKNTVDQYKCRGLAMIIELFTRMLHLKGAIGVYGNLDSSARKLGMHKSTLIDMMKNCDAFVVDEKRKLYYSPCLRGILKLKAKPTTDELDDIVENGNIYLGWCKRHSREKEYAMEKAKRIDKKKLQKNTKNEDNEKQQFNKDSIKMLNHIEKPRIQSTDNQAEHSIYKDKDKYISSRNILTTSNKAFRNNIPPCDDADEENIFKKYFTHQRVMQYDNRNIPGYIFNGMNNIAECGYCDKKGSLDDT